MIRFKDLNGTKALLEVKKGLLKIGPEEDKILSLAKMVGGGKAVWVELPIHEHVSVVKTLTLNQQEAQHLVNYLQNYIDTGNL